MLVSSILPHLKDLHVQQVVATDGLVTLRVQLRARTARCPACQRRSRRIHSHYTRRVADLPIAGRAVVLSLHVRRFRCTNPGCPRVTFAEQLPSLVARSGRRTELLRSALEHVGLVVGGRPGQRLGYRLGLVGTYRTLLRLVRALPEPASPGARVLGVDEFAVRRGRVYGTVLVDVESHRPVDLLDDRSAAQFAAWLRDRPLPEVICRDRGGCYAEGARQGAPNAIQVADRYHLLANLAAAVERLTAQHARCWQADPLELPPAPEPAPRSPTPAGGIQARHQHRYQQIQTLVARGMTLTAIGRLLHLDRQTVRKFARASSAAAVGSSRARRSAPPLLSRFLPYLHRRWQEGCADGAQLFAEIAARGYRGSRRTLRRYLTTLRQGRPPRPSPTVLTARTVASLLLRHPAHLSAADAALLDRLGGQCTELVTAQRLVREFAELVCQRQGGTVLRRWLQEAATSEITPLVSFAAGLRKDLAAVVAGVTLPWSSGVVEGHNTRIKLVKRQMYGRGGFDLLRRRVLLAS
ncbi:MAG: ISL3 family transposase [Streptosporangiaceae bacterium]